MWCLRQDRVQGPEVLVESGSDVFKIQVGTIYRGLGFELGPEVLRIEMRVDLGGSRSLGFWFGALEF